MLLARLALAAAALLFIASSPARAQQQRAAVLEFEVAPGVKGIDRTYLADRARSALGDATPKLFIMTRESTDALLQANGKSLEDCTGECEVEVGRKLGADFIVSGRVTQFGSRTSVTMRLFSTADGQLLASAEAAAKSIDELFDALGPAFDKLFAPLAAHPAAPAPASVNGTAPYESPARTPAAPGAASGDSGSVPGIAESVSAAAVATVDRGQMIAGGREPKKVDRTLQELAAASGLKLIFDAQGVLLTPRDLTAAAIHDYGAGSSAPMKATGRALRVAICDSDTLIAGQGHIEDQVPGYEAKRQKIIDRLTAMAKADARDEPRATPLVLRKLFISYAAHEIPDLTSAIAQAQDGRGSAASFGELRGSVATVNLVRATEAGMEHAWNKVPPATRSRGGQTREKVRQEVFQRLLTLLEGLALERDLALVLSHSAIDLGSSAELTDELIARYARAFPAY